MVSFPKISPNLLLGVGGVIAAVFLVNELRKAGGDLQKALSDIQLPSIGDISFPEIKFPDVKFPDVSFPEFKFPEFPDLTKGFEGFQTQFDEVTKGITQQLDDFSKTFVDPERIDVPFGEPDPITGEQKIIDVVPETGGFGRTGARRAAAEAFGEEPFIKTAAELAEEEAFRRSLTPVTPEIIPTAPIISPVDTTIISELPIEQPFVGGGISFIGATIRENPIDTLQEAIELGLTASQARDFLEATGGTVTPSQIESGLIDPDIRNIVGGIIGGGELQSIPVSALPLETLSIKESEAQKAAEFTCREFGLNCELVDGMMA